MLAVTTLAAVALSGCAKADDAPVPRLQDGQGGPATPPAEGAPLFHYGDPQLERLDLSGCDVASTLVYVPASTSFPAPPDGWEAYVAGGGWHFILALDCQRISWGGFERGPLRVLADTYQNAAPAQDCRNDPKNMDQGMFVNFATVDDVEVAARLAEDFGLPVQVGDLAVSRDNGDAAWRVDYAGHSSSVTFSPAPVGRAAAGEFVLYWGHGDGLGRLSLDGSLLAREDLGAGDAVGKRLHQNANGLALAELSPPFLQAAPYEQPLPAVVSEAPMIEGRLQLFEDTRCTVPVS